MTRPDELERVRAQLKELGYLSHRVDRLLLQDALRPAEAWRATLRLAVRIGILASVPVGAVAALALGLSNRLFDHDPLGLVPLWLHLALPSALVATGLFLALGALELVVLSRAKAARLDRLSGALTAVGGLGAAAVVVSVMRRGTLAAEPAALIALALVAGLAGYAALTLLRGGLLALAVARTGRAPVLRRAGSWVVAAGALLAAVLVVAPAVVASRAPTRPKVDQLPSGPGVASVLLGVDGVLPEELDYLMQSGRLPALAALGATRMTYLRPDGPPASLWTSVATGVTPEVHEVRAVDGFRPAGVGYALAVPAPLRTWWESTMVPLGVVEHRPALSSRRSSAFVWELVARGGRPVVVAGWWSTYPAAPLAGALIAHGASQLLGGGTTAGIASDAAALELLREVEADVEASALPELLRGLPAQSTGIDVAAAALRADWVSLGAAQELAERHDGVGVVAVYLAAPDLLAFEGLPGRSPLVFAELLGRTLDRLDAFVATIPANTAVAIVVDPGRRDGRNGQVLWRPVRATCGSATAAVEVTAVAAMVARELGLPASREGGELPPQCSWPAPSAVVPTWGPPPFSPAEEAGAASAEYLESLRSLGYIGG